jgi:hypothetical protein
LSRKKPAVSAPVALLQPERIDDDEHQRHDQQQDDCRQCRRQQNPWLARFTLFDAHVSNAPRRFSLET